MGNSNDTSSHGHDNQHHHQHHHSQSHHKSFSADQKTNETVDSFTHWLMNQENADLDFLLNYFSQSNIIRILFTEKSLRNISNATALAGSSGEGDRASESCTSKTTSQPVDYDYLKTFLVAITSTYSSASIAQTYIDFLYDGDDDKYEMSLLRKVIYDCLLYTIELIDPSHYGIDDLSLYTKQTLHAISLSLSDDSGTKCSPDEHKYCLISKQDFKTWILSEFPELFYGFHNWLMKRVKEKSVLPTETSASTKGETKKVKDLSDFMNCAMAWYFCCNLSPVYLSSLTFENTILAVKIKNCFIYKEWSKLYSSESNGLSLNRFMHHLANYKAPTILFIYCKNGTCYAICTTNEYREAPTPYGDEQTRIYQIWPVLKCYDMNTPSKSVYLNTRSRGLRLGLIFGDNERKPIIKIDEDFYYVDHDRGEKDLLISLEVWGCGTKNHLDSQKSMKQWENKQVEKMRTVKLNAEWGSNPDKAILDLAGIQTDHSQRSDI